MTCNSYEGGGKIEIMALASLSPTLKTHTQNQADYITERNTTSHYCAVHNGALLMQFTHPSAYAMFPVLCMSVTAALCKFKSVPYELHATHPPEQATPAKHKVLCLQPQ